MLDFYSKGPWTYIHTGSGSLTSYRTWKWNWRFKQYLKNCFGAYKCCFELIRTLVKTDNCIWEGAVGRVNWENFSMFIVFFPYPIRNFGFWSVTQPIVITMLSKIRNHLFWDTPRKFYIQISKLFTVIFSNGSLCFQLHASVNSAMR